MILFLSGVGATLGLFLMLGAGYLLGRKNTPKAIARPPTVNENELEIQRERQRKMRKAFDNLMSYDAEKAYERGVK